MMTWPRSIGLAAVCVLGATAVAAQQRGANPNAPPRVMVYCDPCTVDVGKTSVVHAYAEDPNRKPLTIRWSAKAGSFANASERETEWTAPTREGKVEVTAVADNGSVTASNTVTITVRTPQKP
jgi:hypothetical protein